MGKCEICGLENGTELLAIAGAPRVCKSCEELYKRVKAGSADVSHLITEYTHPNVTQAIVHSIQMARRSAEQPKIDTNSPYYCKDCNIVNGVGSSYCCHCGKPLPALSQAKPAAPRPAPQEWTPYVEPQEPQFNGIYRVSAWTGNKTPIYCPRCHSDRCRWYVESYHEDAKIKTKTRYTVNLNPLHPFTLVNKKEKQKVIRPEVNRTEKKIICDSCGHIFY